MFSKKVSQQKKECYFSQNSKLKFFISPSRRLQINGVHFVRRRYLSHVSTTSKWFYPKVKKSFDFFVIFHLIKLKLFGKTLLTSKCLLNILFILIYVVKIGNLKKMNDKMLLMGTNRKYV